MIRRAAHRIAMVLAAASLLSCAGGSSWRSQRSSDHPLAGRIWDTRASRFVDARDLFERVRQARFVLLGEVHDNPVHHDLQLRIIQASAAAGSPPALGMEQFDAGYQARIEQAQRAREPTAEAVADAGAFDRPGWNWRLYEPLVTAALHNRMPLLALNLSRADARRVAADGFGALGAGRAARLGLESVWSDARDAALRQILSDAHCGRLPEEHAARLIRAQRARDAVMAEALSKHAGRAALAVLGNGHARRDLGVPLYLERLDPGAAIVAIGLTEVEAQRIDPAHYAAPAAGAGAAAAYDFVWFTPRPQRKDPCAGR